MAWYSKLLNFNSSNMHLRNLLINRSSNSLNHCRTISIKPAIYEHLNVPPPPKKPLTPYMTFALSTRTQVVKDMPPPLGLKAIFKEISERWAKYDEQEKQKLREEYNKSLQEYKRKMAEYQSSLTPEQKMALQQYILSITDKTDVKKWNKALGSLGKPKKPVTSFLLFLQENRHMYDNIMEWRDVLKALSKDYSALSEEKKNEYKKRSRENLEQYVKEKNLWESEMVRSGNFSAVQSKAIRNMAPTKQQEKKA